MASSPKRRKRRLRAMMAGPDRDAFEIQEPADFFGVPVLQDERKHADLFAGGPDQAKTVDPRRVARWRIAAAPARILRCWAVPAG